MRPPMHRPARRLPKPNTRPSASARGYDARWRRIRNQILVSEPLCRVCSREGRVVPAVEVDHADHDVTNLDPSNLVPLCKTHHSRKTVAQDGGFGRAPAHPGPGQRTAKLADG